MNIFSLLLLSLYSHGPAYSFLFVVPSTRRDIRGFTKIASGRSSVHPPPFLFASSPGTDANEGLDDQIKTRNKSAFVAIWPQAISVFIATNYFRGCWPAALAEVPYPTFSSIHAVSGMLFAGSIITTTVLEWMVVESHDTPTQRFWFDKAPVVEEWIVLPALTGSIVSGIGQACARYGSFQMAPFHIQCSLYLLLAFGFWWGLTDRPTQAKARAAVENNADGEIPAVLQLRRVSNIISCAFLVGMYGIMVLKPGY